MKICNLLIIKLLYNKCWCIVILKKPLKFANFSGRLDRLSLYGPGKNTF
jgi:hypothetical protein